MSNDSQSYDNATKLYSTFDIERNPDFNFKSVKLFLSMKLPEGQTYKSDLLTTEKVHVEVVHEINASKDFVVDFYQNGIEISVYRLAIVGANTPLKKTTQIIEQNQKRANPHARYRNHLDLINAKIIPFPHHFETAEKTLAGTVMQDNESKPLKASKEDITEAFLRWDLKKLTEDSASARGSVEIDAANSKPLNTFRSSTPPLPHHFDQPEKHHFKSVRPNNLQSWIKRKPEPKNLKTPTLPHHHQVSTKTSTKAFKGVESAILLFSLQVSAEIFLSGTNHVVREVSNPTEEITNIKISFSLEKSLLDSKLTNSLNPLLIEILDLNNFNYTGCLRVSFQFHKETWKLTPVVEGSKRFIWSSKQVILTGVYSTDSLMKIFSETLKFNISRGNDIENFNENIAFATLPLSELILQDDEFTMFRLPVYMLDESGAPKAILRVKFSFKVPLMINMKEFYMKWIKNRSVDTDISLGNLEKRMIMDGSVVGKYHRFSIVVKEGKELVENLVKDINNINKTVLGLDMNVKEYFMSQEDRDSADIISGCFIIEGENSFLFLEVYHSKGSYVGLRETLDKIQEKIIFKEDTLKYPTKNWNSYNPFIEAVCITQLEKALGKSSSYSREKRIALEGLILLKEFKENGKMGFLGPTHLRAIQEWFGLNDQRLNETFDVSNVEKISLDTRVLKLFDVSEEKRKQLKKSIETLYWSIGQSESLQKSVTRAQDEKRKSGTEQELNRIVKELINNSYNDPVYPYSIQTLNSTIATQEKINKIIQEKYPNKVYTIDGKETFKFGT